MISSSCDSAKTTASEASTEKSSEIMDSKMVNEGYVAGVVKHLENSACSYILIDEKLDTKYDPINIDEAKFAAFKKDASKVYFKFTSLRRMNRCSEARPIQLLDIKLRSE
jgi:hypothetical protein